MGYKLFAIALGVCHIAACSSGKESIGGKPVVLPMNDSTEYVDDRYFVTRVISAGELNGKWNVESMVRMSNMAPEKLDGVTLSFAESLFGGNAPCNSISGEFTLRGSHIKFSNIISTKMACDKLVQENVFLDLLKNKVVLISIEGNELLLKDKSGDKVIECKRE
jgi:heat shock protein HslJ